MAINRRISLLRTISYQQFGIVIAVFPIILFSLLLAGCTSAQSLTLLNIYIVSLSYQDISDSSDVPHHTLVNSSLADSFKSLTNATSLEIRIGYFALCFRQTGKGWTCGKDPLALTKQLHSDQDPFNLVWQSAEFKDTTVSYGIILATIVLLVVVLGLLANIASWQEKVDDNDVMMRPKMLPPPNLIFSAIVVATFAYKLAILSMVWQHIASIAFMTAVRNMTYGGVRGNVGVAGLLLGWIAVAITICVNWGLGLLDQSFGALERLEADDHDFLSSQLAD